MMRSKQWLIDANELLAIIHDTDRNVRDDVWITSDIESLLEDIEIVDAVEVVHGRWKKDWCDNNMIGHEYEECSICGCSMIDTNQFWDSDYCPNCGAKMDGE